MRKLIFVCALVLLVSCTEETKNSEPARKGLKDDAPESISYRDSTVEIKSKDANFKVSFPIFYSDQNHRATDSLIYVELSLNQLYGANVSDFLEEWERVENGILGFEKEIFLNEKGFFSAKISAQYDRVENDKYVNLNLSESSTINLLEQLAPDKKNEFYELLDVKTIGLNTDGDPLDLSLDRINFTFDMDKLYLHLHHPLSNKIDVIGLEWDEVKVMLGKNSDFQKILSMMS
jgi:hypothetical protein